MTLPHVSRSTRTLIGGVVCLAILGGMMVGHAWPLWAGRTVLLRTRPVDPRDLFRGEFVRLDTPATRLFLVREGRTTPPGYLPVRGLGAWARRPGGPDAPLPRRGEAVFVQLERREATGEYEAASINDDLVAGAINLRGRIRRSSSDGTVHVDYGLDAFYMQEGTARPVEHALVEGRHVQMEVAVASSGRARIRMLLVDGTPVR
jgi:uncharacterized membrane-anchored protein